MDKNSVEYKMYKYKFERVYQVLRDHKLHGELLELLDDAESYEFYIINWLEELEERGDNIDNIWKVLKHQWDKMK